MNDDVTVVIPSIPTRTEFLREAVASVNAQTHRPEYTIIVHDLRGDGAAETRTRGLMMVNTTWTAFLDDDDYLREVHLAHLLRRAEETDADLVFPWFDVVGRGARDPFPLNEKRTWDPEDPHHTTVTFLVKTALAKKVGGFMDGLPPEEWPGDEGRKEGEEFRFVLRVAEAGGKVEKLYERTWLWRHHGANTSGQAGNINEPEPPAQPKQRVVGYAN
jgi:hypothetical protein